MACAHPQPTRIIFAVLCAMAFTSATASSARAQIGIVSTEGERMLVFDRGDKRGRVALLTLIVQAKIPTGKPRELRIRFHPTGPEAHAETVRLNEGRLEAYPEQQPVVFTANGKNPRVRRGYNVVRLRVGLARAADPAAADGFLCLRAKGLPLPPIQVHVVGNPPTVAFKPETAKLQVTSDFLGLWGRGGERDVRVSGSGVRAVIAGPDAQTRLVTDDGKNADARLSFSPARADDGHGDATVRVTGWDGAGAYEGTIQLNPGADKPAVLPVEAKMRRHWLVAVIVVLAGGLVGGVGLRAYALHRRRAVLRIALKDAEERYRCADKPEDLYTVEAYTDILGSGERFPSRWNCHRDNTRQELAQLYCDIYKAKSDGELEAVAQRTQVIVAEFERWRAFKRERDALRLALLDAAAPSGESALYDDVQDVLLSIGARPPDEATADSLLQALRRWRQIVAAYSRLSRTFAALTPAVQRRLHRYDPDQVYSNVSTSPDAPPADVWRLLQIFEAASDALARPADAPEHPPGLEPGEPLTEKGKSFKRLLGVRFAVAPEFDEGLDLAPTLAREAPEDRRTATEIARSLRRWDYVTAGITAGVTAVAYVVTVYDDTYGDIFDYLSAFGAGFLAQGIAAGVKTAFEQLPPFMSDRLEPAAKKS